MLGLFFPTCAEQTILYTLHIIRNIEKQHDLALLQCNAVSGHIPDSETLIFWVKGLPCPLICWSHLKYTPGFQIYVFVIRMQTEQESIYTAVL